MSLSDDYDDPTDCSTMRGRDYPAITQFTVFLENRVGQLLELVRRFEGSRCRIVAINIHDSTECSIVRFVLSHPELGREILERAGVAMIESDLIGVILPTTPQPLLRICTALLQVEVNLVQAYPLMVRPGGKSAVALMVDNIDLAIHTLKAKNLTLISEDDLVDWVEGEEDYEM
ncbi:MAG TPA: acetolactate synthase [Pirellulaceae bacterium]|nr:acetolactate synthase [Pirellulaceae bacterium]HMO90730.1 acetolactate synthase [Pirellulaceae bacterium]HMP67981.1 acetolactate synthase [Pirellulaceae bacterium]